ncbi:YIP1 family protein [Methanogenium sp. MK-MG]|uniref:YIP1 family protein n=1 Tax=Methanogenium sp. MK-MG TaxID=2599926 RepID=UPI0013E9F9A2|nr:YIP1 family protein [Methanogenium sp. MK-MG]KAF1078664.1 hypothetical protein MKMG_00417 [Methanogenium sp. MK-MG]
MTTSPAVRVKSHSFDLFLTQKRLILTQPDYPDAHPVDILFTNVLEFSRGETAEGDPSLFLTVTSGGNERMMVLAFDGGGGFKAADERDRVAELVAGMLEEVAAPPPAAPAPPAPDVADAGALPSAGSTDILVSAPAPSVPAPPAPPAADVADTSVPSPSGPAETTESAPSAPSAAPQKLSPPVSGLKADHIIVKGHEFTASLTPELLSLVHNENPEAVPLTVRLADITGIVPKESAGGDPSLHLRVRSAGGNERTMVLVFSEWYSGGRAEERDEWAAALTDTTRATVASRPSAPVQTGARISPAPVRAPAATQVSGGAKFCTGCGASLTGSPRFCPNCGMAITGGPSTMETAGGIRDLPFDTAADERTVTKRRTRQKREKPEKRQRQPGARRKASFRFRSQELGLSEVPFVEKYIGFLAAPDDAFRYTKNDTFGQAIIYLASVLAIFAAVTSIVLHLFAGSLDAAEYPRMAALGADLVDTILLIPKIVILGIVAILLWSVVMHILLRLVGQSDDVTETFQTCAYAATPFGTVGLIPFFGAPLAALWMLFLQYKGLVGADGVESRFAALAVAVPVILFGAIFLIFLSAGGSQ